MQLLEHIMHHGVRSLSDAELLALLALVEEPGVQQVLQMALEQRGGLSALLDPDLAEYALNQFGHEVAAKILAVMELVRRVQAPKYPHIVQNAQHIYEVSSEMRHFSREKMRVLVLDTKSHLVASVPLYAGTCDTCALQVSEVFRPAIVRNCPALALVHNHPTGDPTPSSTDIETTMAIIEAANHLDVTLLDHVIIGNPGYFSLKRLIDWPA